MFCVQCGEKLPDNARFCFACGAKLDFMTEDTREVPQCNKQNLVIQKIADKELKFDAEITKYIDVHKSYCALAEAARQSYLKAYQKADINSLEGVVETAIPLFAEQSNVVVGKAFDRLLARRIDTYTQEEFLDMAISIYDPSGEFEPYFKSVELITEWAEKRALIRTAQRNVAGPWVGGGFGIKGAIKGAVTAGVLNAPGKILRNIGSVAASASDAKTLNQMREKAYPKNTGEILGNAMYQFVMAMYSAEIAILNHNNLLKQIDMNDSDCIVRLNNCERAIANGQRTVEEAVTVICQCLQANPFNISFYTKAYSYGRTIGKENENYIKYSDELFALAEYFGVQERCKALFNKMDEEYLHRKLIKDELAYEEYEKAKITALNEVKEYNPYFDETEFIKQAQNFEIQLKDKYARENFEGEYERLISLCHHDIDKVWDEVSAASNALAEYVLSRHYEKGIVKLSLEEAKEEIAKLSNRGEIAFVKFLEKYLLKQWQSAHGNYNAFKYESFCKPLIDTCISARAYLGWENKQFSAGLAHLKYAAEKNHPFAMAWYGEEMYYGNDYVKKDREKSFEYIRKATYANCPYAITLNKKLGLGFEPYVFQDTV